MARQSLGEPSRSARQEDTKTNEVWTAGDVSTAAIQSLSVGQQVWLADAGTKSAVNKALHGIGFSAEHGDGFTDWTKDDNVYRVLHQLEGHDDFSRVLRRER